MKNIVLLKLHIYSKTYIYIHKKFKDEKMQIFYLRKKLGKKINLVKHDANKNNPKTSNLFTISTISLPCNIKR